MNALRRAVQAAWLASLVVAARADEWSADLFRAPPNRARPQVHWHWMSGNVTPEGITADLEAMHRIGVGGTQIYNASPSIPHGPVDFMSPEWRRLTRFALQEAQRLGLEMGIHNCAGWSSSGGPWVPVEESMMELTWSETRIEGRRRFAGVLATPFHRKDFYRDEVVLAVPAPEGGTVQMRELSPRVTSSTLPGKGLEKIADGDQLTVITGPSPSAEQPQIVTITLDQAFTAQTLTITPGPAFGAHGGSLEGSLDGQTYTRICDFQIPEMGNAQTYLSQGFAPTSARYFRLTFNKSDSRHTALSLAEIELLPSFQLADWRAKAGFISLPSPRPESRALPPRQALDHTRSVDLTGKLAADGHLEWEAPPGRWILYRFGYTTKDKMNKPGTPESVGYECDKMSRAALDTFWSGMMKTVLTDNADLVGKSFRYVMLDSFEVGSQNYTRGFPALFARRTGYSMLPYMPALTGAVVDSIEVTERFLWDFRRVVADLWKENYFEHLDVLAKRVGLKLIAQAYGNGNFDWVAAGTGATYPMTEFWVNKPRNFPRQMTVSSSAHLSGQSVIFSESFTAHPQDGAWKNSPGSVKVVGDLAFCDGVNAIVFHTYAHQPWLDARPGMTMGPYGIHFNRGNTWFESAGPWMDYLARSQWLLRRGLPVVDFVVFAGENSPVGAGVVFRAPGFHTEFVDRVSLQKMRVDDGRLALPGGMTYRVLVVPDEPRGLSLPVLRELGRLAREGATIVANRPTRTPSLQGFPESETELRRLADEVWGTDARKGEAARALGRGRIISGKFTAASLARSLQLQADCELTNDQPQPPTGLEFIHVTDHNAHAYFVSNQSAQPLQGDVAFRVSGLRPELWDPLTGETQPVEVFGDDGYRTVIPLALAKTGSMFVVFRAPSTARKHIVPGDLNADLALSAGAQVTAWASQPPAIYRDSDGTRIRVAIPAPPPAFAIDSPWTVTLAEKGRAPAKFTFDELSSWSEHPAPEVRYFSGTATYETDFVLPPAVQPSGRVVARLELGRVEVIAEVRVNGHPTRILWAEPFAMDVTDLLIAGQNHLEIRVTNNWPNRLIGDQIAGDPRKWAASGAALAWPKKLDAHRWPELNGDMHWTTWRHYTKDSPLQPSGLLGPVRIVFGTRVPLAEGRPASE